MNEGAPRVKNRAAAAVQVTAEQLLREVRLLHFFVAHLLHSLVEQAQATQEVQFKAPKQRVEDFEELHEYRGRKR